MIVTLVMIGFIVFNDSSPVTATLLGLAAATYLLATHRAISAEVALPALLFAGAGLLATALPVPQSSWLPLAAPVAVVLIYVLAVRPFLQGSGGAVER